MTPTLPLGAQTAPRGSSSGAGPRVCVEPRGGLVAEWCTWFAAWLLLLAACTTPGCASSPQNPACGEDHLAATVAQCVTAEIERGCDSDPINLCPELVADCERRIDEWEGCR